jgi:hypothetical protein
MHGGQIWPVSLPPMALRRLTCFEVSPRLEESAPGLYKSETVEPCLPAGLNHGNQILTLNRVLGKVVTNGLQIRLPDRSRVIFSARPFLLQGKKSRGKNN